MTSTFFFFWLINYFDLGEVNWEILVCTLWKWQICSWIGLIEMFFIMEMSMSGTSTQWIKVKFSLGTHSKDVWDFFPLAKQMGIPEWTSRINARATVSFGTTTFQQDVRSQQLSTRRRDRKKYISLGEFATGFMHTASGKFCKCWVRMTRSNVTSRSKAIPPESINLSRV